jgi:opacity protein-like surface antigen
MKKLLLLALTAAFVSTASFAQDQNTILKLGNVVANQPSGTGQGNATGTREDILADPRITIIGRNITVSEFTISYKMKGSEFMGPFAIKGDKLTPAVVQRLKDLENPDGMVYVEGIKVIDESKTERTLNPIIKKMVVAKK